MSPSRFFLPGLFILFVACSSPHAAEPVIRTLDLRGLRVGGTTTLTLDGDNLGKTPRLLLPFAATQTLKPGGTDKKAIFDVLLANDVPPGYYNLRLVAEGGVSAPEVIGVDRLPQQAAGTPVTELPIALHGSVAGSNAVEVKFAGKAKQKVMVEVEAQRFNSKLRPVVHLLSPKKLQLGWSWGTPSLSGDTRLEVVLPEDGTYTVTLHDAEYAAPNPSFFRLKIGEWSFVDQVFPPVVARSQPATVELLGMAPPVPMNVSPPANPDVAPLAWPKDAVWSGPRPFVTYSSHAEVVQQPAGDKPQELPAGLVGVSGRLVKVFGEDRYRVPVSPGQKVRLEVFAERLGSPIDTAIVVRNDQGGQLARGEDSPGTLDPVLEYTVPDKVTSLLVGVADALGRGGPRGVYRLVIDPQTSATRSDGFKLTTTMQNLSLAAGARLVIPFRVERKGYTGKIDLTASLPAGVTMSGGSIPDGADGTLLTLERSGAPFDGLLLKWRGRTADGTERVPLVKGHPLEDLQPWLASEIALAASDAKASDLVFEWRNLPPDLKLIPGTKLALPVKAMRPDEKTTVKLTLLTSQVTPIVNNQPDPNKSIRQEKPVELPAKMTDGEVVALLPVELPSPVYDVTVQAELLAADKKVLATAFAPVQRLSVHLPVVVKLTGPARIETAHDGKKATTINIQGKIERDKDLKTDVALTLTGMPPGVTANPVTVKADATDFTLPVTVPPNVPAGEIKGLRLTGTFAPDAKQANVRVRSKDVEITLVLQAPAK